MKPDKDIQDMVSWINLEMQKLVEAEDLVQFKYTLKSLMAEIDRAHAAVTDILQQQRRLEKQGVKWVQ